MDSLTGPFLLHSKDMRRNTHHICRLMERIRDGMELCIIQSNKSSPSEEIMERQDRLSLNNFSEIINLLKVVKDEFINAQRNLSRLINRFGASNMPLYVIQQYKSMKLANDRSSTFAIRALRWSCKITNIRRQLSDRPIF